jgi:hypothetical protein
MRAASFAAVLPAASSISVLALPSTSSHYEEHGWTKRNNKKAPPASSSGHRDDKYGEAPSYFQHPVNTEWGGHAGEAPNLSVHVGIALIYKELDHTQMPALGRQNQRTVPTGGLRGIGIHACFQMFCDQRFLSVAV